MSAEASTDPAVAMIAALDEAARLLEAGDSPGAAQAMSAVVGRCPSLSAESLGAEGVANARRLLERCRQAEARLRQKLGDEMASLGSSRRAQAAYR